MDPQNVCCPNWSLANFQNVHILGRATIKALDMGVRRSGFSRF